MKVKTSTTTFTRIAKLILLSLCLLFQLSKTAPHCLNEKGQYVSFFMAIRFHPSKDPREYIILDSKSKKWRKTTESELLPKIFGQVDLKQDQVTAWNDEAPNGKCASSTYAHSKGIIAISSSGRKGFFMSHSIPKFPKISETEISPVSNLQSNYGQHILCVSISSAKAYNEILQQLAQSHPYIYYGEKPNGYDDEDTKVIQRMFKAKENTKELDTSPASMNIGVFKYVTKPKYHYTHIFEGFMAPFWKTGFLVETWGRPLMPSNCDSEFPIVNVKEMGYEGLAQTESRDHSKWALGVDEKMELVCMGDLNHQESQAKRGGSFLCLQDKEVYQEFRSLVKSDECNLIN